MKIRLLNAIKHDAKRYDAGDVIEMSEKNASFLINAGAAEAVENAAKSVEYDGEKLFEETDDLSALKVDELKAICKYLDIPAKGTKDALIEAIEAVSEVE